MTKTKNSIKRQPAKSLAKKPTKKEIKPRIVKEHRRRGLNAPIVEEDTVKKYVVRLSAEERMQLKAMVHKGTISAGHMRRAQILLKADVSGAGEAWSDSRIIEALNVSALTVCNVRKQLVEEGFEAVLTRKKRETPPIEKIFDGEKEAKLIALTCSKPPAGYARWSLRLLENKVVELGIVDKASDNTIGRVLKKIF